MKRTLLFQNPGALNLHNGQMVINRPDAEPEMVPIEDVGLVMVESQQFTMTEPVIVCLADNNVPLVCCDANHCPASISFPMKGHCFQGQIIKKQLAADKSVSENLWREIVRRKITAQIGFLQELDMSTERMNDYLASILDDSLIDEVVAMEGAAAKFYFDGLFGKFFRRGRYGKTPNDYLNYGYTVLRAVVIRELIGSGLFLGEGLYHCNRSNEFPLADDVIEPYRVYVDRIVYDMFCQGETGFDSGTRQRLLKILSTEVKVKGFKHTLSDAVGMTAVSVMKILTGSAGIENLVYPDVG